MLLENRKITVDSDLEISSAWGIPDNYDASTGSGIILAHGAGNDMHHAFMSYFHQAFAEAGMLSVKFNFPYTDAGRKAPDRMELLEKTWRAVVNAVRIDSVLAPKHLYFVGKSMGGRVASHIVAKGERCDGLIFLGYPLHPAKQTEKLRVEHWADITCPVLFIEGTRDPLCDLELLKAEIKRFPAPTSLHVIEGGDHSFKVPKSVGIDQEKIFSNVKQEVITWLATIKA